MKNTLLKAALFIFFSLAAAAWAGPGPGVPPPPQAGSEAFAKDESFYELGLTLRKTPRGELAAADASLDKLPALSKALSSIVGFKISKGETPATWKLLKRARKEVRQKTRAAKEFYQRPRPFIAHKGDPTCLPPYKKILLRSRQSYPSGHASSAYAMALAFSLAYPAKAGDILALGARVGESRWICGVHWESDVGAGQTLARAEISRLQEDPSFQALVDAARKELAKKGSPA